VRRSDPIFDAVTAPGTPFEVGVSDGMRRFVNAPADLNDMLEAARRHGESICLVEDDQRISYSELFRRRDALTGILDIEPGDRVAICMRNRSEWMVAFLAVMHCGGIAALVNSRGSPAELCAAIGDVTPTLVLTDAERAALLREGGYAGRLIEADDFPSEGDAAPRRGAARADDPVAFPGNDAALLARFPPTLLMAGSRDFSVSTLTTMHRRLLGAGVDADLVVFDGLWHAFLVFPDLPESKEAYTLVARFFDHYLGHAQR